jgi:hypothetical protein
MWLADNTKLNSPSPTLGYRKSMDNNDRAGNEIFIKYGELVRGESAGPEWVRCFVKVAAPFATPATTGAAAPDEVIYYLPKFVKGSQVMVDQGGGMWMADNSKLGSQSPTLGYRKSMDLNDRADDNACIKYGNTVRGEAVGSDWVKCYVKASPSTVGAPSPAAGGAAPGETVYYLPKFVKGLQVMVSQGNGMWLADNSKLNSPSGRIGYRKSMDSNDRAGDDIFLLYGETVRGEAVGDDWVKCFVKETSGAPRQLAQADAEMTYYLPRYVKGVEVMVEQADGMWLADNSKLKSTAGRIGYRNSMDLNDRAGDDVFIAYDEKVRGEAVGSDWVKCFVKAPEPGAAAAQAEPAPPASEETEEEVLTFYLPKFVKKVQVMVPQQGGMWLADNTRLGSTSGRVGYRNSTDTKDRAGDDFYLKYGDQVKGEAVDSDWVRCLVKKSELPPPIPITYAREKIYYLPKFVKGVQIMVPAGDGMWLADNSKLQSKSGRIGYRRSMNLDDRAGDEFHLVYGDTVKGDAIGEEWVRCFVKEPAPVVSNEKEIIYYLPKYAGSRTIACCRARREEWATGGA